MLEHSCHGSAAPYLGMWIAMMTAMMLPSVAPTLWRYRQSVRSARGRAVASSVSTALVGLGYVFVWGVVGAIVYPLSGINFPPIAKGAVIVAAGALQFSPWKARHLACCRRGPWHGRSTAAGAGSAWRDGVRLGVHCVCSCAGPMAILMASGMTDLPVMAVVTAGITIERLAPAGERVASALGTAAIGAGVILVAHAV